MTAQHTAQNTERYFAIGDLHGHFDEWMALMATLQREADFDLLRDHLVLCGDLVDVGPKSKEVVEHCMQLSSVFPNTFHPLKGNHDDMFVDATKYSCKRYEPGTWYTQGGEETLRSYAFSLPKRNKQIVTHPRPDMPLEEASGITEEWQVEIPKEHLNYLESLPHYYWPENSDYFFVHAGIPPEPLSQLDPDDPKTKEDMLWIRSEFYRSDIDFGRKIIFAHTPFEKWQAVGHSTWEPFVKEHMIGLNTMPRDEGKLTCVELPAEKFYFQPRL